MSFGSCSPFAKLSGSTMPNTIPESAFLMIPVALIDGNVQLRDEVHLLRLVIH